MTKGAKICIKIVKYVFNKNTKTTFAHVLKMVGI